MNYARTTTLACLMWKNHNSIACLMCKNLDSIACLMSKNLNSIACLMCKNLNSIAYFMCKNRNSRMPVVFNVWSCYLWGLNMNIFNGQLFTARTYKIEHTCSNKQFYRQKSESVRHNSRGSILYICGLPVHFCWAFCFFTIFHFTNCVYCW